MTEVELCEIVKKTNMFPGFILHEEVGMDINGNSCDMVYLKDEADKVIAELKENHKKEVEQLLMEIAEQKNEIEKQKRLRDMALASMPNVLKVMKIIQHHKYKRCLAMADMSNARYDEEDAKVNGCGASWEYISKEMKYWERWSKRWLEIAEKFKETK